MTTVDWPAAIGTTADDAPFLDEPAGCRVASWGPAELSPFEFFADESGTPARDDNPPAREESPSTRATNPLTRENNPPMRENNPPTRNDNPPMREANKPSLEARIPAWDINNTSTWNRNNSPRREESTTPSWDEFRRSEALVDEARPLRTSVTDTRQTPAPMGTLARIRAIMLGVFFVSGAIGAFVIVRVCQIRGITPVELWQLFAR